MESIEQILLKEYVNPIVAIGQDYSVLFANNAAVRFFGPLGGKKCYEFLYQREAVCPLCVMDDLTVNGWAETITRSRFIREKDGTDVERYAVATPYTSNTMGRYHIEAFEPIPKAIEGTRAIMSFADELEQTTNRDEVFCLLVEFLGSDQTDFECRARFYSLERDDEREVLRLTARDHRIKPPSYVQDVKQRDISRRAKGQFNATFACIDQNRWFLLTPEPEKLNAFRVHFRATARNDGRTNFWDADPGIADQKITLYLYDKAKDGIVTIFKDVGPHTFLDIPIRTKKTTYGKLSITLWGRSFLFYREDIEQLRLIEEFVTRRLEAIEFLEETKDALAQNVIHEVSQPAFAGLASMEALRRRDREDGRTASDEQVDYYLKKNVECSLKMVAFLNDRGRITEDVESFSETPANFLSDIVAPVVNLVRFAIYEKHLRNSGEKIDASELEDIPSHHFRSSDSVKSVLDNMIYEIAYDARCAEISVYIEKYRLQQVMYNLLNNAVKYKGRGCDYRVSIQYRSQMTEKKGELFEDYFVIDVADRGYGVEEGEEDVIFELWTQGKNARKVSPVPGTGRGLYVCRAILRGVGGEVFVQNLRGPTVFRLLIPRECADDNWIGKVDNMKQRTQAIMRRLREGE